MEKKKKMVIYKGTCDPTVNVDYVSLKKIHLLGILCDYNFSFTCFDNIGVSKTQGI